MSENPVERPNYKDTLNLPQTDFEMRAGLAQKEPQLLSRWESDKLYDRILATRARAPRYVLHDGPPYANGHLHHGHILNKILKDIVVKDRTMQGYRVPFVPGWDCHGLPIEVQVDKELGARKAGLSKGEIRKACRAYAASFVDVQRKEFRRLGVLGRWDEPYLTMSFGYEAQTLRELAKLVDAGLLYKGLRPVNWCTVHQTALAEAEVEYEDHTSPSIYVAFALQDCERLQLVGAVDLVIWTTTPWTLPANLAISAHPDFDYIAYPVRGRTRIFARGLAESFLAAVGEPAFDASRILGTWKGRELEGLTYRHAFIDRSGPVLLGDHVTLESGTGLVHTAPGHGAEDFDIGRRHGLAVLSPVDGRGVFTHDAGAFAGETVFAANPKIVALLQERGALLSDPNATVRHRYAHCWRCHKPIILRATEQWWVAIDKPYRGGASLRQRALAALKQVTWIPAWGEDRIRGMMEGRPDWCLSRQRVWGVPIAVVYCEKCGEAKLDANLMRKVADRFEKEGADAWFVHSVDELVGPLRCACGGTAFRKEEDILDVWFDSGVSYAAVIEREEQGHTDGAPVDLYLEGSDQHRGWFHSSLLCSLATRELPPYRAVLTHGFVVDGDGKKISKSKGNFVDPFKAIEQNGAEILRLWVAAEDYREDIRISQEILTRLTELYRKVRNTLRYLLGNLSDFDPNRDMLAPDDLQPLDRYALDVARERFERIAAAYRTQTFHIVMQTLNELCTVELSAFYLDVLKDRLYCYGKTSVQRRSAQTALYLITRDLLRLCAPIVCFTAEEAWGFLPRLAGDPDSVHLCTYPGVDEPEAVRQHRAADMPSALREQFAAGRSLREQVNLVLEEARRAKTIGSSAEASVTVTAPADQLAPWRALGVEQLADVLIVSAVRLHEGGAFAVHVEHADGIKCARCWLYRHDVDRAPAAPGTCARCAEALAA